MFRLLLSLTGLLLALHLQAQEGLPSVDLRALMSKDGPAIKFGTYEHNVGTFSKRKLRRRGVAFQFYNTGNEPLVITFVDSQCRCVSAYAPKQPIPPGGFGYITIIYEGHDQLPGFFRKGVFVGTNSPRYKVLRLFIEGEMTE